MTRSCQRALTRVTVRQQPLRHPSAWTAANQLGRDRCSKGATSNSARMKNRFSTTSSSSTMRCLYSWTASPRYSWSSRVSTTQPSLPTAAIWNVKLRWAITAAIIAWHICRNTNQP